MFGLGKAAAAAGERGGGGNVKGSLESGGVEG